MSQRFRTAARPCFLLFLALCAGEAGRAGPFIERGPAMAKEKEAPAVAKRETQAETRPTKVRLCDFVLQPERYSHRSKEQFKKERLQALMDSLVSEGQQVPIEFFRDKDGRPVVLKGHRRVYGERYLADDHVPHFTHDMEVDALEVVNATPEDRLHAVGPGQRQPRHPRHHRPHEGGQGAV
jgi:hypothetical protein